MNTKKTVRVLVVVVAVFAVTGCSMIKGLFKSDEPTAQALPSTEQSEVAKIAAAAVAKLSEDEIRFNDNWQDKFKPKDGYYAAKWYKGTPQVMCYNDASRDKLPPAVVEAIIDYLSANRPKSAADLAKEDFGWRAFKIQAQ